MRSLLLAIGTFVAAGCGPSSAPFAIGHVAPLTGRDKELAEQAANGIRLAVEDYTAQKPARPVVVRHADDKGDPDVAEGQAVRLVTINHAYALLGGWGAAEAIRLDRAGSLLLTPIGRRDKSMGEFAVITGLSPARIGKALAQSLHDAVKPANTVLVVEPSDDAAAIEAAFQSTWAEAKRPAPARQEIGDAASEAFLKWAAGLSKDVLPIVIGSPATLKTLALETPLRDRPLGYAGPEIARRPLKDRAAPLYLVSAFGGDKAPDFAARYETKFQSPAEPHAAIAYDDARLAIEVSKKGPLSPKSLRDDLNALKEFAGLTGTFKIASGVVERPAFAGRLEKGRWIEAKQ
jgi:ABC-type branched-subunit amino acid transport system substrate-binding protein